MSKKKKKGNGRHTMSLKDFHGGSIPPHLPLPSPPAPAFITSHSSLPCNSSLSSRHFDGKTPFLTHTAPISSNFDEEERKPLDDTSASRRTVNDECIWGLSSRAKVKSGKRNSYSARLTEASHVGVDSQNLRGSRELGINGASSNVLAMRRDVASSVKPDQSAWSGPNASSKLVHANAIDKVSSGRWQSKKVHSQMDFEIGISSGVDSRPLNVNGYSTQSDIDMVDEKRYSDKRYSHVMLARHAERSLAIDDQIQGCRNELPERERCGISNYIEVQSRYHYTNGVLPALNDAKLGGTQSQHSVASEPRKQPKLNLSRWMKPLDSEPSVADDVQLCHHGSDSRHVETVDEAHDHANIVNGNSAGTEIRKGERQRPKLNLKSRPTSLEKFEGNTTSDRSALFGGARPRELVLKERGVDDAAINNYSAVEETNRVKKLPDQSMQINYIEKLTETLQRAAIKPERRRRDQWVDAERTQRRNRNWPSNYWRNWRVTDREQNFERPPSLEMWRKPVEQQNSSDAVDLRHSKATSVELAQAFSRSMSDPKMNDTLLSQCGDIGCAQQPFSRLIHPTPKPSSNG